MKLRILISLFAIFFASTVVAKEDIHKKINVVSNGQKFIGVDYDTRNRLSALYVQQDEIYSSVAVIIGGKAYILRGYLSQKHASDTSGHNVFRFSLPIRLSKKIKQHHSVTLASFLT